MLVHKIFSHFLQNNYTCSTTNWRIYLINYLYEFHHQLTIEPIPIKKKFSTNFLNLKTLLIVSNFLLFKTNQGENLDKGFEKKNLTLRKLNIKLTVCDFLIEEKIAKTEKRYPSEFVVLSKINPELSGFISKNLYTHGLSNAIDLPNIRTFFQKNVITFVPMITKSLQTLFQLSWDNLLQD
ncbi:hypothetical protein BpHYR1_054216 [Brachionus plicatilis]|uniref:Uncharacterized protein n=1 Tax=Brachionus plicatilis TaxID=10195 RepID=A0A3M7PYA1_BRAPC|nr:hypothetical protein BpHYR1_054216 [Brachionus plicatilis]